VNAPNEYLSLCLTFSPLFFFIIAVSFRLLDNSALLFLQKEILVNSSNVSVKIIKEQIHSNPDEDFTRQLRKALVFRKLHRMFITLTAASMLVILLYLLLS
jgi:hypothetical protein